MARISPASPEILAGLAEDFEKAKKTRGYVANSWYTLARKPKIFKLFRQLSSAVMQDAGEVPAEPLERHHGERTRGQPAQIRPGTSCRVRLDAGGARQGQ